MKLKYSIPTIAIAGLILAQTVVPAFAQNLGGLRVMHDVNKLEKQATGSAGTTSLQGIIQKGDSLITNRLASLNNLLTRIQSDKRLSDSEKSSLTSEIQSDISGLTTLKAKIDADTDVTTARTDVKSIITNYYVYAMFEPKIRLLITINNMQTITTNVQTLVPQIQKLIDTFKSQGKDVTQIQSLLDDVSSQLSTISSTLSKDATTVQNVSTTTQDKSTVFVQVRQDLAQIVRSGFAKIRSDFAQMRQLFKAIISPSGSPSPSKPVTTCMPRPACLDATPRCLIAEPVSGWCPTTTTPTVSGTPSNTPGTTAGPVQQ